MLSDVLDRKVRPYLEKEPEHEEPLKQQKQDEIRTQTEKTEKEKNIEKEANGIWKEIERLFKKAPAVALRKFYSIIVKSHFGNSYLALTYKYEIRSGEEFPWKLCSKEQLFKHYYEYSSVILSIVIELAKAEGIDAKREDTGIEGTRWVFTYTPKTQTA